MSIIQKKPSNENGHLIGNLTRDFETELSSTLPFNKYSKSKIKDKTLRWNEIAVNIINKINDEEMKDDLAFKFSTFMINKSIELSGEHPFLVKELEERFIRKLIRDQQ